LPGRWGHPDPGDRLWGGQQVFCRWLRAGTDRLLLESKFGTYQTHQANGLSWSTSGHRGSAGHHHREKTFLSGHTEWLKVGIEGKMRQRT